MLTPQELQTVYAYRNLFDAQRTWSTMTWRGHASAKIPNDMWLYQEAIFELKPSLIVEFGTNEGGSALFLADVMDAMESLNGRILTIDILRRDNLPRHPRISYFVGHSRHDPAIAKVKEEVVAAKGPVMFIEDSEHSATHIAAELEIYAPMVTPGSYFVVEDCGWPDQTMIVQDVIAAFLKANPDFEVDDSKGRYLMTLSPGGWVKRRKS